MLVAVPVFYESAHRTIELPRAHDAIPRGISAVRAAVAHIRLDLCFPVPGTAARMRSGMSRGGEKITMDKCSTPTASRSREGYGDDTQMRQAKAYWMSGLTEYSWRTSRHLLVPKKKPQKGIAAAVEVVVVVVVVVAVVRVVRPDRSHNGFETCVLSCAEQTRSAKKVLSRRSHKSSKRTFCSLTMSAILSGIGNFLNDYRLWIMTPLVAASVYSASVASAVSKDNPSDVNKATMVIDWVNAGVLLAFTLMLYSLGRAGRLTAAPAPTILAY